MPRELAPHVIQDRERRKAWIALAEQELAATAAFLASLPADMEARHARK